MDTVVVLPARTKPHFLTNLINEKWEEYGLDNHTKVSAENIRARYKRNVGNIPVLSKDTEEYFAKRVVELSKGRPPLSVCEVYKMVNSALKDSVVQKMLHDWLHKALHEQYGFVVPPVNKIRVGYHWYVGFSKRQVDILNTVKALPLV
jgi:hypothetical protein